MNITCPNCQTEIEIDKALGGQIEAQVIAAEHKKHEIELAKVRTEVEQVAAHEREAALERTAKQLAGEKELLQQQAADDLALARRKLEQELQSSQKKTSAEQELLIQRLKDDAEAAREDSKKLREEQAEMLKLLREEKQARANAELDAQKKLAQGEDKIREEAEKSAMEKQRLRLAEKDNQLESAKKQLEEMQRKLNQGSQQLQGEILELDLEEALAIAFRDDDILPVAKGVSGADISQVVKSQSGIECGVILWEIKRTKNWVDGWIPKLKADLRSAKADIPVIISDIMPKQLEGDLGYLDGVWVVKPKLATTLAKLLRKGLLDVGRQKALTSNQGDKASALYSFVTSHEFSQQIESMIETYQEMTVQVTKERVAYEKLWSQREKQAQKLLMSTANIVGSMQGYIGQASMPKIKGLELGDGQGDDLLN